MCPHFVDLDPNFVDLGPHFVDSGPHFIRYAVIYQTF